jgi:uncharacterized membrane protein YbaN (DUF454 family)
MSSGFLRAILLACGTISVALGVIGIFLPLMPTTVFLLLAAACYARSSERFYRKLVENRWLGGDIRRGREGGGMSRRQKAVTLAMLWAGILASAIWSVDAWWIRAVLAAIAVSVTIHVVRIPALKINLSPAPLDGQGV